MTLGYTIRKVNMQTSETIRHEDLPRCTEMDGSTLKIVPAYTEAGYYQEANCITVTDGERVAVYVPYKVIPTVKVEDVESR